MAGPRAELDSGLSLIAASLESAATSVSGLLTSVSDSARLQVCECVCVCARVNVNVFVLTFIESERSDE